MLSPSDNAGPWSARLFRCALQQPVPAVLAPQPGVLHGCMQVPGHCHLHCNWAGRSVMHTDIVRVRAPDSLTEAWLPAHVQVQAVLAGIQAGPKAVPPNQAPPGGQEVQGGAPLAPAPSGKDGEKLGEQTLRTRQGSGRSCPI